MPKVQYLRPLSIIIIALILTCFTSPEKGLTDLEKYRLKGSVKSVMEIKFTLADKSKNAAKDKILYQKYILFDKNGYETDNIEYRNGTEFLRSVYTFGTDGKPDGLKEYKPDGSLNLEVTFLYDDKGNKSEAVYNWADNFELGEIVEKSDYYFEVIQNDLFYKILYKSEYRGFFTEEKYIKDDGSTSFYFTFKYDPRGNKLESAYYHSNGRLSWITKYKYDRYDNLIESRLFKSNRIAVLTNYKQEYDDTGNWVKRREEREVHVNILTAGLERADMITERIIEYY